MNLISTRTALPREVQPILGRSRLDEHLGRARLRRLTLLRAPSGYGKTSLLVHWVRLLRDDGVPTGWLSLPGPLSSGRCLFNYLQSGMSAMGLPAAGSPHSDSLEDLSFTLVNRLAGAKGGAVFVIDDADQLIGESAWLLATLLAEAPWAVRFFLGARGRPSLPLARLRSQGEVLELGATDLAFRVDEAMALAKLHDLARTTDEIEACVASAAGWAAGLILSDMNLANGRKRDIYDYFEEETARLGRDNYDFLCRTSVLDRLELGLCEAVSPGTQARRTLIRLESAGAFLVPLDEERSLWRYQQLFGDYLHRRFEDEDPVGCRNAHLAAADCLLGLGRISEALHHLHWAGATARLAATLESHCDGLTGCGDIVLVSKYARALPDAMLQSCPRVLLTLCWLRARKLDAHGAEELLGRARQAAKAQAAAEHDGSAAGEELQLLLTHREIMVAVARGELVDVEARCLTLLATVPHDQPYIACTLYAQILTARTAKFRFEGLGRLEGDARSAYTRAGHDLAVISTSVSIGTALFAVGRTDTARQTLEMALRCAERHDRASPGLSALPASHLAEIVYELNELEAARTLLDMYQPHIREFGLSDQLLSGHVTQARLKQAQGDPAGALTVLRAAWQEAVECGADRLKAAVLAEQIRQLILLGRVEEAARLLDGEQLRRGSHLPEADSSTTDEWHAISFVRLCLARNEQKYGLDIARSWRSFTQRRGAVRSAVRWTLIIVHIYLREGDTQSAKRNLHDALVAAAPGQLYRSFLDEGTIVIDLFLDCTRQSASVDSPTECFTQRLRGMALGANGDQEPSMPAIGLYGRLMSRELEILRLVASGLRNGEIGQRLGLTEGTVKWYLQQVYDKLGERRRSKAVLRARHYGLIT